jgi:uncharacterized protein (DUF305 family)
MNTEVDKNPLPGILLVCVIVVGIIIVIAVGIFSSFSFERRAGVLMDSDRMFIEQMIPHHQDAIDMGNLALVRAEHPEIGQLAENIIRDQSREISRMREWYRAWYGIDVPIYPEAVIGGRMRRGSGIGMMGGGMSGSNTDLVRLGNATNFDKEFIEQMVPHHQMAIMMAGMVQNSEHREMRVLGSSIIRSQSAEINQMRVWYSAWYGMEVSDFFRMGMNRSSGS